MRYTPTCSAKLLGTRDTTFVFFGVSSLSCILHIWGVCYFKARCFNRVLPPAGQNPENGVFQPGAASGGSESWKMRWFNRVLPPAGQNPEK